MERRSFFGLLFGGLLSRFLPKPKLPSVDVTRVDVMRVDTLDLSRWGEMLPPQNLALAKDMISADHLVAVCFVTKNGYVTAPSVLPYE